MSAKSNAIVDWESQLEAKFCNLLEFDPVVVSYCTQPEQLHLPPGLIRRKYTPDFGVVRRDGRFIYEVKPLRIATKPEWEDLFHAAREQLAERGIQFEVATESDIEREPLVGNVQTLLGYRSEPLTDALIARAREWLAAFGPTPFEHFATHFDHNGRGVAIAYALLANHQAVARIDTYPLDLDLNIGV